MKLIGTITLLGLVMGSAAAFAADHEARYKDLNELKELHVKFHQAVSHAGASDEATKNQHIEDVLALWTDDGVLIVGGVAYTGKGTPGAADCAPGAQTLCDFYANHAASFVLGNDYVSLTPIFTEAIRVLNHNDAEIYFQCIYLDVNNNDLKVSNVTFGLPGAPGTGRARKVHGRWFFSFAESEPVPPPTLDVYQ